MVRACNLPSTTATAESATAGATLGSLVNTNGAAIEPATVLESSAHYIAQ